MTWPIGIWRMVGPHGEEPGRQATSHLLHIQTYPYVTHNYEINPNLSKLPIWGWLRKNFIITHQNIPRRYGSYFHCMDNQNSGSKRVLIMTGLFWHFLLMRLTDHVHTYLWMNCWLSGYYIGPWFISQSGQNFAFHNTRAGFGSQRLSKEVNFCKPLTLFRIWKVHTLLCSIG